MKIKGYLLALVVYLVNYANAQEVFLHIVPGRVFKLESDYSLTLIATETYSTTVNGIGDIAIAPNHVLYGISTSGEVISIDWNTGVTDVITQLPSDDFYTSLTCSAEHELYTLTASGNLYKFNLFTDSLVLVDQIGTSTPGDLTFYRGNLVFQNSGDGHIKAYNLSDGTLTTILCRQLPLSGGVGLWGISNLGTNCDSGRIFASDNASHLFQLNVDEGTIDLLQYYEFLSYPQAYEIWGMASENEYQASDCSFKFSEVDCNSSSIKYERNTTLSIYPNPTSDNFRIETNEELMNVVILNSSGNLNKILLPYHGVYDVNELPAGVYFISIFTSTRTIIEKLIKY